MIKEYPISSIRSRFPILRIKVNNEKIVYLDNAASTQKPDIVIDAESNFYKNQYSSVHRGAHTLSNYATHLMEKIRKKIACFIKANSRQEIIFVKGATEAINLVAYSWARKYIQSGDNIVITEIEHHSNIVPWQILAKEKNLDLRYIPCLLNGDLDISKIPEIVDRKTRLFAITHMSNVLGSIIPLKDIISIVRNISDALILVDGTQSIVHYSVDVQNIDCDFYVFSGHKLYGPSGIGVLYAKKSILESMIPWESGGSMIDVVSLKNGTSFNRIPWRFEAGSPNIAGIVGLGAAIKYINKIGIENINKYEINLINYAFKKLSELSKVKIYGLQKDRISIISFNIKNHNPYDIGCLLDSYGIAIRTGHQCAMPLMERFNTQGVCRISLAMYNNKDDIDRFIKCLVNIFDILK